MRKGGGGVDELRSAIKDKFSHVFLRGFPGVYLRSLRRESLIGLIRGVRFRI